MKSISDLDIYRAANLLIQQRGADAERGLQKRGRPAERLAPPGIFGN